MQLIKTRTSKNKSLYIDLVSEIFIVCLITYILNYVCNHYSTTTSWYILAILFLLPIIFGIITYFFMVMILSKSIKNANITKTLSKTLKKV